MKTIKAFIRTRVAQQVIKKLENYGVKNITVEQLDEPLISREKQEQKFHYEILEKYNTNEKIEFVCEDKNVDFFCSIIKMNSKAGPDDEGVILVQQMNNVTPSPEAK